MATRPDAVAESGPANQNGGVPGSIKQFEREFAGRWGAAGALATGFGRSALRLAFEAIGCRGRCVLLPDFICRQVIDAAHEAGAAPEFFPVQSDMTIRTSDLAAAVKPGVAAAVLPHYFGRMLPNIVDLVAACRQHGVAGVEDCALALGASLDGRPAGTFGDMAVFSLTKSDWCQGGGLLISRDPEWLEAARFFRRQHFIADDRLAFRYGLLRRLDWTTNRPRWCASAERAGRWLEGLSGNSEANFYDAGRFDAAISGFAVRRARKIIRRLNEGVAQRRRIQRQIIEGLAGRRDLLFRRGGDPGDSGAFLLLRSAAGRARQWLEEAAGKQVTLRLTWPAYQEAAPGQHRKDLQPMGESLLILEIHPRLADSEIQQVTECLNGLGQEE